MITIFNYISNVPTIDNVRLIFQEGSFMMSRLKNQLQRLRKNLAIKLEKEG